MEISSRLKTSKNILEISWAMRNQNKIFWSSWKYLWKLPKIRFISTKKIHKLPNRRLNAFWKLSTIKNTICNQHYCCCIHAGCIACFCLESFQSVFRYRLECFGNFLDFLDIFLIFLELNPNFKTFQR